MLCVLSKRSRKLIKWHRKSTLSKRIKPQLSSLGNLWLLMCPRIDSLNTTSRLVVLTKSYHHLSLNRKTLLRLRKPKARGEVSRNSSKMNRTPVASNQLRPNRLPSSKKRLNRLPRTINLGRPKARLVVAVRRQYYLSRILLRLKVSKSSKSICRLADLLLRRATFAQARLLPQDHQGRSRWKASSGRVEVSLVLRHSKRDRNQATLRTLLRLLVKWWVKIKELLIILLKMLRWKMSPHFLLSIWRKLRNNVREKEMQSCNATLRMENLYQEGVWSMVKWVTLSKPSKSIATSLNSKERWI